MHRSRTALSLLLVPVFVLLAGCRGPAIDYSKRLTSLDMVKKRPPDALYTVDPPDQISIEFTGQAEMNRSVVLRSDGRVTLPLLGDILVAGKTTKEITDLLSQAYSKYYKDPQLLVSVTGYNSKHIYMYGEVGRPGQLPYTGYMTVRDAIGEVGGVTSRAASGRVKVVRGDPDDPEIFKVDLDAMIDDGDTLQDVSLAENDTVYVPPTVLAWIGYQVDSLLFPFRSLVSAIFTANTVSNVGGGGNGNRGF
jgi:polysaccharide export outer membrane protein